MKMNLVPPENVTISEYKAGTTVEVQEGQLLSITCQAQPARPFAKLIWYRNGIAVDSKSCFSNVLDEVK